MSTVTGCTDTKSGTVDDYSTGTGMKVFHMIALDLDGTLLQSNHQVSDETRDYLLELHKKGIVICIATGRSATTVYEHIEKLALPHAVPVVCSNGARGLQCSLDLDSDRENGGAVVVKELFSTPVPESVVRKTIDLGNQLSHVSQYYVGENIYANPKEPHHYELCQLYMDLTGCKTIYVEDDFEQAMELGLPSKQLVLCPVDQQDTMMELFEKELCNEATIIRGSLGWFLEVLHPQVNKGDGLKNMCRHLNLPLEHVVAFGDGDNDLEFLQVAGHGVVMKNGRDVVKEIADEVIEFTNDEEGVAKTLRRMEAEGSLISPDVALL